MGLLNKLDLYFLITVVIIAILLTPSRCQFLSTATSSSIDLFAESIKTILRLDQMLDTFRKVSASIVPFPLFVPIPAKSRVIELFGFRRSKKSAKPKQQQSQKKPVSSSSSSQIIPVSVPPPPGLITQIPAMSQLRPMDVANSFFNYRSNYEMPEFPVIFADMSAASQQSVIDDDIKDNSLEMSGFDYTNGEDSENVYAERSETDMRPQNHRQLVDLAEDLMGHETEGNPVQMMRNWEALDFELKRLGNRLGRLGALLKKDQLKIS